MWKGLCALAMPEDQNDLARIVLDALGHHLVSGCAAESCRTHMHDLLVLELKNIANYSGIYAIREEIGCFKVVTPDNDKRPDLSFRNAAEIDSGTEVRDRPLILDVSVTDPVPGSTSGQLHISDAAAKVPDRAAEQAFKDKNTKYLQIAHDNGLSFLPIIFESTGRVHGSVVKMVKSLAALAEEPLKIAKDILYSNFMNRLSVVLQRSIAGSILQRSVTLNGHLSQKSRNAYVNSHSFVTNHYRIRSRASAGRNRG